MNSINWARILAQITYYFHSYFSLLRHAKSPSKIQFVVPTGNFGDILAGYYAKKMGLPITKLVVATNENDILDRFFKTGRYEKKPFHGAEAEGGEPFDGVKAHEEGVKETLSPAMDILVSSNFERLLWYLARECETEGLSESDKSAKAGQVLKGWMDGVKKKGGIVVSKGVLEAAQRDFTSFRVSDKEVCSYTGCVNHRLFRPLQRFIRELSMYWTRILQWEYMRRVNSFEVARMQRHIPSHYPPRIPANSPRPSTTH